MDFPSPKSLPPILNSWSECSLGWEGMQFGLGAPASAVYPTANKAFYIPFRLLSPYNVRRLFVANGTAVSGNIDLGIYSLDGARIFSTGSTAQAGTSALQYIALGTDILLSPGTYYWGISVSNVVATVFRSTAMAAYLFRQSGILEQLTAFPLPNPATFAAPSLSYLPLIGMSSLSSGF